MKYCLNYNRDTEHANCIHKADEWTIEYNSKDSTLLEFLDLHSDKRINLYFKDIIDLKFLEDLCKKYNNLYIKLSNKFYENIKENKMKIRFFFDTLVNNWDTFIGLLEYGVTDIYITEELGFELKDIKKIAKNKNIGIRVYPNVAQSAWTDTLTLKKFFIRPEDIDMYSEYIDTIEFYKSDKKIDIYYKIYAEDKKWFGKLNEFILDFNSDLDSRYIIPRFAERRINCRKKCLKGGRCRHCDNIEQLSYSLEESELIVKIDKDNNIDKK